MMLLESMSAWKLGLKQYIQRQPHPRPMLVPYCSDLTPYLTEESQVSQDASYTGHERYSVRENCPDELRVVNLPTARVNSFE